MVTKVEMYRTKAGAEHATEHEAWRAELFDMLLGTGGINEASTKALVEWLCNPREKLQEMREIFQRLYDTHPQTPAIGNISAPAHVHDYQPPMRPIDCSIIGTNRGHGHVWARPDGVRARCGGPALCKECAADQALRAKCPPSPTPDAATCPHGVEMGGGCYSCANQPSYTRPGDVDRKGN